MDKNKKLSLFRDGDDDLTGFVDVKTNQENTNTTRFGKFIINDLNNTGQAKGLPTHYHGAETNWTYKDTWYLFKRNNKTTIDPTTGDPVGHIDYEIP